MKPRKPVLSGQLGDTDLRLLRIYRWIRDGLMRTLNPVEYRYITQYSAITRKGAPSTIGVAALRGAGPVQSVCAASRAMASKISSSSRAMASSAGLP
jgi:hypothetical protein